MLMSALLASPVPVAPKPHVAIGGAPRGGAVVIECSSRPTKKATAHHMKTRPRKSQPWDIKRKPTVYAPLPKLPPDWTLVTDETPPPAADAAAPVSPEAAAPAAEATG